MLISRIICVIWIFLRVPVGFLKVLFGKALNLKESAVNYLPNKETSVEKNIVNKKKEQKANMYNIKKKAPQ